ncbi:MAG: hypothetical protein N2036_07750 [Bryobacteraceae bacterium]|nr:hypothetical protein [Bryobacteraceae bacterium]MCX7603954.1 hypothetical protein [Bryobacteraceae bacterium]
MVLPLLLAAMTVAAGTAQEAAPQPVQAGPEILQIHTVYLLPMANSFDQYLANHITRQGVLRVVADPAKADAILTDRIGKPFEKALEELYPQPKPEEAKPSKAEEEADRSPAGLDVRVVPDQRASSLGRGRGTVFLVARGSRHVVWSIYARPRRTVPDELDATARRVASELQKAIRQAAKPQR